MNKSTTRVNARREPTPKDSLELEQVRLLTKLMREHEQQVVRLGKQRRRLMRGLKGRKVPYRLLAESTNTTEQAVYKDLRWGK